ncbi:DoxX family protein [Rhodococcus tukisamuensis]|uniref:Putative oxidoreductase n=1 Tax=Rhodococcus tukisamuensis TaxID=168276 RepID=A0A1G7C9C9_9NOCA|nr:DoxX family protein [Rhodococcus tukisamuensis]SDE35929.1 putative oxidoreductase [Rhodococcus tukisamuensis]
MKSSAFKDLALLVARVGIGVIFVAHGWQKFFTNGIAKTQAAFDAMGAPLPDVSAIVAATVELVGGFALIAGIATPIAGILLFLDMVGAFFIVHIDKGIFVSEGGYELVLALGVSSLLIAAIGAGRLSIDALLGGRFGSKSAV